MSFYNGLIRCGAGIVLVAVLGRIARGEQVVVNFDNYSNVGLTPMGNSPGATVPAGAQLSNQYLASEGLIFQSASNYVAIGEFGTTSSPAGIGGVTPDGLLSYDEPVTISFFMPGTNIPAVTSAVSIAGDAFAVANQSATFTAYDINGIAINSQTRADTSGVNNIWSVSSPTIHSVTFSGGNQGKPYGAGTGIALDDLKFEPLVPAHRGDATGDGVVDAADLAILHANAGQALAGYPSADFNGDGLVNTDDYAIYLLGLAQYNASIISVPEPGQSWIAAGVVMAVFARRGHRRIGRIHL